MVIYVIIVLNKIHYMKNLKSYLVAGVFGFIGGVLFAPHKGSITRLKAKKAINDISMKAIDELEKLENKLSVEI